jgi:hypothetical protein
VAANPLVGDRVTAAMTELSRIIAFAAGVVALLSAGVVLALQAQADVPPYFPTRLRNISDSRQVIVVVGGRPPGGRTVPEDAPALAIRGSGPDRPYR